MPVDSGHNVLHVLALYPVELVRALINITLHWIEWYCIALHHIALKSIAFHYIELQHIISLCDALHVILFDLIVFFLHYMLPNANISKK